MRLATAIQVTGLPPKLSRYAAVAGILMKYGRNVPDAVTIPMNTESIWTSVQLRA